MELQATEWSGMRRLMRDRPETSRHIYGRCRRVLTRVRGKPEISTGPLH